MKKPWDFNGYPTWAYTQGNFNEKIIPELIKTLQNEKRNSDAEKLKMSGRKKLNILYMTMSFHLAQKCFLMQQLLNPLMQLQNMP